MNKFEELEVWKEAHKFVLMIYKTTSKFPRLEDYRLTSQIIRSAISIAANIVEGNARSYTKEFLQYINMAKGSLEETKYHLLLAKDLKYINEEEYTSLINQAEIIGKLMNGMREYLRNKIQLSK